MKTCPVCALEVEDSYLFCPDDGSVLRSLSRALPENDAASISEPNSPKPIEHPSSKTTNIGSHYPTLSTDAPERGFDRPGIRVAAIAIGIGLAVFAVVATYALVSAVSRRPPASLNRVATTEETSPQTLSFVETPQEARDYQASQAPSGTATPQKESAMENKSSERVAGSTISRSERGTSKDQSAQERSGDTPSKTPAAITRVSTAPLPALPRGNAGGFDARLIHARSRRTPLGFRYDLTFNIQEQSGRPAQWRRLLITTTSTSGLSHSDAIPFVHHLGATGALGFTISVELNGRSEVDWHGRVVCTALGWDNAGAPLQSSFGANVAP